MVTSTRCKHRTYRHGLRRPGVLNDSYCKVTRAPQAAPCANAAAIFRKPIAVLLCPQQDTVRHRSTRVDINRPWIPLVPTTSRQCPATPNSCWVPATPPATTHNVVATPRSLPWCLPPLLMWRASLRCWSEPRPRAETGGGHNIPAQTNTNHRWA